MAHQCLHVFFGAILTSLVISCSTLHQDSSPVSPTTHAETLPVEVEDNEPLLYASLFNHPHRFESVAFEALIGSLYFSPINAPFRGPKSPIFSEQTIREVEPLFLRVFGEAKPYQKVQFHLETSQGPTIGDTFILDGALHWRFHVIQGTPQYEDFYNIYQFEGNINFPRNWDLVPQGDQHFFASELLLGVTKEKKDWIVVTLSPPMEEKVGIPAQGMKTNQLGTENKSFMERLRLLRELKNEGLISEEDFQGKLRTLVDEENATVPDSKDRLRFLKELRDKGAISEGEYKHKVHEILEVL